MPTFNDPLADAAEASEALRGLAHASRTLDNPADTYAVFGDVISGVRSLRQVLDQLADAHLTHRERAHDDAGNHAAGAGSALTAADELHQAGTLLDQVHDRLDAAFGHSGKIAWHPEPALEQASLSEPAARRWVSVVFLQGEDADEVLDLIDRDGTDAAIEHLKRFDYGDETTSAAMENGYVYDEPPAGPLDRVVADGDYTLTSNAAMGHVSLLRAHPAPLDPPLVGSGAKPSREAMRTSPVAVRDWFAGPAGGTASVGRGLSL